MDFFDFAMFGFGKHPRIARILLLLCIKTILESSSIDLKRRINDYQNSYFNKSIQHKLECPIQD